LNIFGKWKTNSTATGPKPRSAQLHSRAWPRPTTLARPVCTARAAHGHSTGSARCTARAARDGAARERTPEMSPLSGRVSWHGWWWRYSGGGGAKGAARAPTAERLPAGHGVEAIAHRSSLSTGRGRKTGSAAAFSDEARAPVASDSPATGRRRRVSGGGDGETTTTPGGTAHLARRKPVTAASAQRSDSSGGEPQTAGRRLKTGRARGQDGAREAR
jgi:hypothetical protein